MNKKLVAIITGVVVVVGLATVVFAISKPKEASTTSQTKKGDSSSQAASATADSPTITYTDGGFDSATLSVKAGTVIRIVNNASSPLEFSSGSHPTHREDPELNMTALKAGEEGTVTVTKVGMHSFHNHLKATDVGTLTVTE